MESPTYRDDYLNTSATLPYGLTPEEIGQAIQRFYNFYTGLNEYLAENENGRLETLIRANNSLSDLIGHRITEYIAEASDALVLNQKPDGYPDILPRGEYDEDSAHHGGRGIETKCSQANGGWQAHNNEDGWFLIIRYVRGDEAESVHEMAPIEVVQVLAAKLETDDWNHSGRSSGSRRTITSSIGAEGVHKLRSNPVYQNPNYITGMPDKKREYLQRHNEIFG